MHEAFEIVYRETLASFSLVEASLVRLFVRILLLELLACVAPCLSQDSMSVAGLLVCGSGSIQLLRGTFCV